MAAATEPVYVFDVYSRDPADRHGFYDDDMHLHMLAWMRANGLNPGAVWRFEVHLIDCPSVRVWEFLLDERGLPYCERDHPHRPRSCVMAARQPYSVAVSGLPPIIGQEVGT
ncbi:hypothetical protein ACBJ59_10840 [Nonomuraea sp. MTCD27]|uniref:hypothetical protein n=1 Tax=Nonomuraea sp. MTCD27 TaxID=1676747 RepID=UPI0035C0C94D